MENNKKMKKYQYYKNNYHDNNRKYYYKKKKKSNKENNLNVINDSNNKEELFVNESVDYNEYEGLLKKKSVHKDINLDDILVRSKSKENDLDNRLIKEENNKVTYDSLVNIDAEESKEKGSLIIGTKFGYVLGVLIVVFALFGSTYAFFNYYKEDTRQADIVAGEAYVRVVENNLSLSLTNQYPRTNEEARRRTDNYIDFTLVGKNTSLTKVLGYKFTLSHGTTDNNRTRISDDYILFDLAELDGSNNETLLLSGVSLSDFNSANISGFYVPTNQTVQLERHYRIRAWISEEVTISDDPEENATYTQAQFANLYANFTLHVSSQDKYPNYGDKAIMRAVNEKINAVSGSCTPIWRDDINNTPDNTADDVVYFKGNNTCVDMNYVWYSGKLWRIIAKYPDGTMKMVTENAITSIPWGSSIEYNGSYVYQWLNEDFYDTLYNSQNILVVNNIWNYSADSNSTPVRPETIEIQKTVSAPVGLVSAYEYNKVGARSSYLKSGLNWFTITPYDESNLRYVSSSTASIKNETLFSRGYGVRPAVVLKSNVVFDGDGTITNPFKIVSDKERPTNNVSLISTRTSGEYVKFNNDLYRIVAVDESTGTTKLTRIDYLRESETAITKSMPSPRYGINISGSTSPAENYVDYYLNTVWYGNLLSTYKNMLVGDVYYLGTFGGSTESATYHYKQTICKNDFAELDNVTTKNCTKYTSSDANKTFTGKVGLPRLGEMFSAQLKNISLPNCCSFWTITTDSNNTFPYVVQYNDMVNRVGIGGMTVRPSITLNANVVITSGTGYVGGDTNNPFEIALPNNS